MCQNWSLGAFLVPCTWRAGRRWFVWLTLLGASNALVLLTSPGLRGWVLGRSYGAEGGIAVLMLSGATGALAVAGVVRIITQGQRRMHGVWLVAVLPLGYLIGVGIWSLYPASRLPLFEGALFWVAAPLLAAAVLVTELHIGFFLLCFLQVILLHALLLRPAY